MQNSSKDFDSSYAYKMANWYYCKETPFIFFIYISQGFYNNDFIGLEFENMNPGDPPIKGEDIVKTTFQMHINYSKWWLTLILVFMAVAYRTVFFFSMKLRENLPMIMSKIKYGRTMEMIERVSSGRFVVPRDIEEEIIEP